MNIRTDIKVLNNVSLGIDTALVSTNCTGGITIRAELKNAPVEVELDRVQLQEFLARTESVFVSTKTYNEECSR